MEHLQNLRIVITAAASGLGSEIATTLSKSGSQVFICDNNKVALENFSKKNPLIKCAFADVSNETQMKDFFSEIKNEFTFCVPLQLILGRIKLPYMNIKLQSIRSISNMTNNNQFFRKLVFHTRFSAPVLLFELTQKG